MIKLLWYLYFGIYLLLTSLYKIKINYLKKKDEKMAMEYAFKKAKEISNHVLKKSKTEVIFSGGENIPDGPCVFIANHQAIFDGFLLLSYVDKPFGFIAKKEIKKIPLVRSWLSDINSIFIDRQNVREAIKAINEGIKKLNDGYSMAIFPEGTRSLSSNMNSFKKGSLKLATKAKVPIVPITIDGTYRVLEVGNIVRGHKVKMVVHKPIYTDNLSNEEKENLHIFIKDIIEKELKNSLTGDSN